MECPLPIGETRIEFQRRIYPYYDKIVVVHFCTANSLNQLLVTQKIPFKKQNESFCQIEVIHRLLIPMHYATQVGSLRHFSFSSGSIELDHIAVLKVSS